MCQASVESRKRAQGIWSLLAVLPRKGEEVCQLGKPIFKHILDFKSATPCSLQVQLLRSDLAAGFFQLLPVAGTSSAKPVLRLLLSPNVTAVVEVSVFMLILMVPYVLYLLELGSGKFQTEV